MLLGNPNQSDGFHCVKHITPVACQSVLMLGKALTFAQIEVYQALVPKAFQYWIKKCEVSLSSGYEPNVHCLVHGWKI